MLVRREGSGPGPVREMFAEISEEGVFVGNLLVAAQVPTMFGDSYKTILFEAPTDWSRRLDTYPYRNWGQERAQWLLTVTELRLDEAHDYRSQMFGRIELNARLTHNGRAVAEGHVSAEIRRRLRVSGVHDMAMQPPPWPP